MRPFFIATAAAGLLLTTFGQAAQAADTEVPACDSNTAQAIAAKAFGSALAQETRSPNKRLAQYAKDFYEAFKDRPIFEPVEQKSQGPWVPGTDIGKFRICSYNAVISGGGLYLPPHQRFVATIFLSRKSGELIALVELPDGKVEN